MALRASRTFSSVAAMLTSMLLSISGCSSQSLDFTQVFVGFDGPSVPGTYYFEDKASADRSWLEPAIGSSELTKIVSSVNFEKEFLVAVAAGERPTATGSVSIDRIQLGGDFLSAGGPIELGKGQIMGFIRVGVISGTCNFAQSASYPFALAIVTRPKVLQPLPAYFAGNFPDGCKAPKSGQPHDPPSRS